MDIDNIKAYERGREDAIKEFAEELQKWCVEDSACRAYVDSVIRKLLKKAQAN